MQIEEGFFFFFAKLAGRKLKLASSHKKVISKITLLDKNFSAEFFFFRIYFFNKNSNQLVKLLKTN
jgi:hypothetical protein